MKLTNGVMGSGGGEGDFTGERVSRRTILNWFLVTSIGAFLTSISYPVARYLIPPRAEESSARTVTLSVKPDDVRANSGQIFKFGSQPGILIRAPGGDLRAFTCYLHASRLHCSVPSRPQSHLVRVP